MLRYISVIIILVNVCLRAELYQIIAELGPQNQEIFFLKEQHAQKVDTQDVERVLKIVKEAELRGNPFHILIEKVNPALTKINQNTQRDLLTDFYHRYKEEIKEQRIDDIEIRRRSGIAHNLLKARTLLSWHMLLMEKTDPVHEEIARYLNNKKLEELSLENVLEELISLFNRANEFKEGCKEYDKLYKYLSSTLDNYQVFLECFKEEIQRQQIDLKTPLMEISRLKANKVAVPLEGPINIMFDFYALQRLLEILETSKKVMFITGGLHCKNVMLWLGLIGRYREVFVVGTEDDKTVNRPLLMDNINVLELCVYDYLISRVNSEKKRIRDQKIIAVGFIITGIILYKTVRALLPLISHKNTVIY